MTKLQKQMTDKSNTVAELQQRLLQLQESQSTLKESYQTAVRQMNDLLAQLNDEKKRSSQLEKQLQVPIMDNDRVQGLQQQLTQLKEERDLLRERVSNLQKSTCAACKAQKLQLQEQQLQVTQLQTALKELQKSKNILSVERINCKDYKMKLEDVTRRRNKDHARYEQKLKQQEKLLDAREAKINQLETQSRHGHLYRVGHSQLQSNSATTGTSSGSTFTNILRILSGRS
uniref:Uncharacterized protein n=1 Tax=Takifugu rubripes TaxID=31033 RepID=A0A3B5KI84_TAKRU